MRGLYAVTPDSADTEALVRKVEHALQGGIALLQYRNKLASGKARFAEAMRLAQLARGYGVPLIVNDDIALALEVGAQGAHLGREDGDLVEARRRLPGRLLGASCYNDLALARRAVTQGADYVAFGSVYASSTKPGAVRAPLELFTQARALKVPLCAIGGITLENAAALVQAGADLLAVITDLFDAPDIAERAHAYSGVFR